MEWVGDKAKDFPYIDLVKTLSASHELGEEDGIPFRYITLSVRNPATLYSYWPGVATGLSNALPSLCPKSISLNLSLLPKQENCSQMHGLVHMPMGHAYCNENYMLISLCLIIAMTARNLAISTLVIGGITAVWKQPIRLWLIGANFQLITNLFQ